jgi:hypothetical protein
VMLMLMDSSAALADRWNARRRQGTSGTFPGGSHQPRTSARECGDTYARVGFFGYSLLSFSGTFSSGVYHAGRTKPDLLMAALGLLRWIIADRRNQAFGKWSGTRE